MNQKEDDTNGAIALLKECSLLKIDDLLPWFPDFVVLDKFKDHIVESLEDYNSQIDELKQEMENYTESAEHISPRNSWFEDSSWNVAR